MSIAKTIRHYRDLAGKLRRDMDDCPQIADWAERWEAWLEHEAAIMESDLAQGIDSEADE